MPFGLAAGTAFYLGSAAALNAIAAIYNGRKGRDQSADQHDALLSLQQDRLALDRDRFQWERERQRQQAEAQRQATLDHARFRLREVAYSAELNRIYEDWPLHHLTPSAFRHYFEQERRTIPLQVLFTPIASMSRLAWATVERELHEFTSEFYADGLSTRPVVFRANEWRQGCPVSRGAFEKIHATFEGAPFVIVDAVETEKGVGFSLAYWGVDFGDMHCRPLGSAVPHADFSNPSGAMDAARLADAYKLIVAGAADIHHLAHTRTAPILPALLPHLLNGRTSSNRSLIIRETLQSYRTAYNSLFANERLWMPERLLEFATALADLDDKSFAQEQCDDVVRLYSQIRGVQGSDLASMLNAAAQPGDGLFLRQMRDLYTRLDNPQLASAANDAASRSDTMPSARPAVTPTTYIETMNAFRRQESAQPAPTEPTKAVANRRLLDFRRDEII